MGVGKGGKMGTTVIMSIKKIKLKKKSCAWRTKNYKKIGCLGRIYIGTMAM